MSRVFPLVFQALAALLLQAASAHAADVPLANGVFLVAKPVMLDPNFSETVVLITEPLVGGGPIGVIVNRPVAARLSEAVPGLGSVPEAYDQIYGGGPVARNQMLFLVRTRDRPEHALQVLADVYLSGDRELLAKIIRGDAKVAAFRAYAGYSGWAPGQLESEITLGGWYVVQADADMIFAADASTVWPELIRRINTRSTRLVEPREALAIRR
jgi:putative transcriptional regulator